jgi:hypothetical protein
MRFKNFFLKGETSDHHALTHYWDFVVALSCDVSVQLKYE